MHTHMHTMPIRSKKSFFFLIPTMPTSRPRWKHSYAIASFLQIYNDDLAPSSFFLPFFLEKFLRLFLHEDDDDDGDVDGDQRLGLRGGPKVGSSIKIQDASAKPNPTLYSAPHHSLSPHSYYYHSTLLFGSRELIFYRDMLSA